MIFEPCPMCGSSLSDKNIRFFDDEGNECNHISDQFVEDVILGCDCGFTYCCPSICFLYDELEDLSDGKWLDKFAELVNERHVRNDFYVENTDDRCYCATLRDAIQLAKDWAESNDVESKVFHANMKTHEIGDMLMTVEWDGSWKFPTE